MFRVDLAASIIAVRAASTAAWSRSARRRSQRRDLLPLYLMADPQDLQRLLGACRCGQFTPTTFLSPFSSFFW